MSSRKTRLSERTHDQNTVLYILYDSRRPVAMFALPRALTKFQRYGTMMSAMPAGMLDVPTPKFRMTVGKSSAVYRGMMTLDEDTENFPAITSDSDTHSSVSGGTKRCSSKAPRFRKRGRKQQKFNRRGSRCYVLGGRMVVNRHAIPPATMVTHNGILRPIFSRMTTLIIIDGISTRPAQRRSKRRLRT